MSKSRLKLTDRDRKILELLAEYGCVSGKRIEAIFWGRDTSTRTHQRRLRVLAKSGLVEKVTGDGTQTLGYRLSKKGKKFLFLGSSEKPRAFLKRSYGTSFRHDQLLIDLRRIFEQSPLISDFQSEAQLTVEAFNEKIEKMNWHNAASIPDAAFALTIPGSAPIRVAIELELSLKSRRRYERIFRNHLLNPKRQVVIYIAKDEKTKAGLVAFLTEVKKEDAAVRMAKAINGIYFSLVDDFLTRGLDAPITNGKSEIRLSKMAAPL